MASALRNCVPEACQEKLEPMYSPIIGNDQYVSEGMLTVFYHFNQSFL